LTEFAPPRQLRRSRASLAQCQKQHRPQNLTPPPNKSDHRSGRTLAVSGALDIAKIFAGAIVGSTNANVAAQLIR